MVEFSTSIPTIGLYSADSAPLRRVLRVVFCKLHTGAARTQPVSTNGVVDSAVFTASTSFRALHCRCTYCSTCCCTWTRIGSTLSCSIGVRTMQTWHWGSMHLTSRLAELCLVCSRRQREAPPAAAAGAMLGGGPVPAGALQSTRGRTAARRVASAQRHAAADGPIAAQQSGLCSSYAAWCGSRQRTLQCSIATRGEMCTAASNCHANI